MLESQKQKLFARLPALNNISDSLLELLEDQLELTQRSHLESTPLVHILITSFTAIWYLKMSSLIERDTRSQTNSPLPRQLVEAGS